MNSFAECNYPKKKFDITSGKKATEAEMGETMGKVKQFQTDLGVYRTCLDDELAKVSPELETYEEIQRMNAQKYNASVEDEQKWPKSGAKLSEHSNRNNQIRIKKWQKL